MPRRRPLLTVSTLVAATLAVAGCTIPTTKDGGGYGPSNQQTVRKAAMAAGNIVLCNLKKANDPE